jgi:hypothetical protein
MEHLRAHGKGPIYAFFLPLLFLLGSVAHAEPRVGYDPKTYGIWQPADVTWIADGLGCRVGIPCPALYDSHRMMWEYLYGSLQEWIDLAVSEHAAEFSAQELDWLARIRAIHDPARRLEFIEDESRFDRDPQNVHRIAVTGLTPADPIYINENHYKRLNWDGDRPLKTPSKEAIGVYLGILVHEMGHHLGVLDSVDRPLDRLGAKFARILAEKAVMIDLGSRNQPQIRLVGLRHRLYWMAGFSDFIELTESLRRGLELQYQSEDAYVTEVEPLGLHWETIEPRRDTAERGVPVTAAVQLRYTLWERDSAGRYRSSQQRILAHLSLWLDVQGGKPLSQSHDLDIHMAGTRPYGHNSEMIAARFSPWEEWDADLALDRLESTVDAAVESGGARGEATTFKGVLRGTLSVAAAANEDRGPFVSATARLQAVSRSDLGVIPAFEAQAAGRVLARADGGADLALAYELPLSPDAPEFRVLDVVLARADGSRARVTPTFASAILAPPAPPRAAAPELLELTVGSERKARGAQPLSHDTLGDEIFYRMEEDYRDAPVAKLRFRLRAAHPLRRLELAVKITSHANWVLDQKAKPESGWPVRVPLESPDRPCTEGFLLDLLHPERSPLVARVVIAKGEGDALEVAVDLHRIAELNGVNGIEIEVRDLYALDDRLGELYEPTPIRIDTGI